MIYTSAVGMINALGNNIDEIATNLTRDVVPRMRPRTGQLQGHLSAVLVGVGGEPPAIPQHFSIHRSHNNRLLPATLMQIQSQVDDAIARFGRGRTAVVLDTSTSGSDEGDVHVDLILNGEESIGWRYLRQELGDPSRSLSHWLALDGLAFMLSTVYPPGTKAIMSERRLIKSGLIDVATVGDADTLSRMPINGFHSLESLPPTPCQSFGRDRCEITIGEDAALMALTCELQPTTLPGIGESSGAYHTSAPHPQGEDAIRTISQVFNDTRMTLGHVGYINLHGTAAPLNDQAESNVVNTLLSGVVPYSSIKHLTGHTLGAVGIIEAAISVLVL